MATPPDAAVAHYRRVQDLQAQALKAAWAGWAEVRTANLTGSWNDVLPALTTAIATVQFDAAAAAAAYGAATIAEQGRWVAPSGFVDPMAFVGYSGTGAPLEAALYSPVPHVKQLLEGGLATAAAMGKGRTYLEQIVRTQVADTARVAAGVDVATRRGMGYVRMLNPPSCDRCVVLAGKFYRWNAGFRRHPKCDCVHVTSPAAGRAEGLVDDPYAYFKGLSKAEQDRIFTAAGAEAIREGADIYQVVNSRRRSAGLTTAEGTSRRGAAAGLRGRRLTPEGIYRQATSREQARELLEQHGYILPGGQVPGGSLTGARTGYGALGRGGTRVGARQEIDRAVLTGQRTGSRYTMTEAERRLSDARNRYTAVLEGRNPYTRDGSGLTPQIAADVETDFRRWLTTRGQVF